MIELDIYRDGRGMINAYRVRGHAGYAASGSDIVCSAISALTQAPLVGLERHLKLKPAYKADQEGGVLEVALTSAPDALTQAILETMRYGAESVARQFPQHVRIREHGSIF